MGSLNDKVIVVAGAAGAQGRVTAEVLAREGATLVLADVSADAVAAVGEEVGGEGRAVRTQPTDITDEQAWLDLVGVATTAYGRLDGMVNFAAVLSRPGLEETTLEAWEQTLRVNQTGAWLGLKATIPALRASGGGSIVNVGSVDALVGRGGGTAYQSAKGGLRLLSKSAATQYAHEGIRVNCVHPGPMQARMTQVVGPRADPTQVAALEDRLRAQVPMGRLGRAADIAHAVRYLLSDESAFVTGIDLPVDGGLTAQ